MALPSKTIELMYQIVDTLDNWPNENQKWNNKIIKDKPENLLSEISENLDYILEELQQHMPNIVELVQEKKKKLVRSVGRVYYPGMASYNSSRRCIISRDDATALANTLRHIAEMAREDLPLDKPREVTDDGLTKSQRLAYESYTYAITQKSALAEANDNDVYNWLKENGFSEDDSYELPSLETWKRHVRSGRKAYGTQKNTPRKVRTGRSIVKDDQIEYTSSQ